MERGTEEIKEFYDSVYYAGLSPREVDPFRNHYQRLAKRLQIQEGQSVLDVACGAGGWLRVCHEHGADVTGLDLSDRAIAISKQLIPEGHFYAQAAEQLPFKNGRFDVVTCLGSLEHFVDPVGSLKEMARVAKNDAVFLFLVPNKDFLTMRIGLFGGTNQVDAREVVRTVDEWERLFAAANLRAVDRWRDLHVLNTSWIQDAPWYTWPLRTLQALLLPIWPLRWQYQIYFLCEADSPHS